MKRTRVNPKGQITIPAAIRRKAGIQPGDEVSFAFEDGKLIMINTDKRSRAEAIIDRLRGSGTIDMSTDEIMELTRGDR